MTTRRVLFLFLFSSVIGFSLAWSKDKKTVYLKASSVKVSSFDDTPGWAPEPNPKAVVDGNMKTRWASKAEDNQWVLINFGRTKTIDKVILCWERAFSPSYSLSVSDNAKTWKKIYVKKRSQGGIETIGLASVKARYLRLDMLTRFNPGWGVSLWEIECYGPKDKNPKDKPLSKVFSWRTSPASGGDLVLEEEDPLPGVGVITPEEFHAGINYTSWHNSDYAADTSDRILSEITKKNIRHIAILTTWYQKTAESTDIKPQSPKSGSNFDSPADEAVGHAINRSHALGMKVMLKPHVDVEDGTYRGDFYVESDDWFVSYKKFILHYARLAQKYNCEMFCVGTELKGTTTWDRDKQWRGIIEAVRAVYTGPLTYAANWDEYEQIEFWDALDYIGIDAYFPLTDSYSPSKKQLMAGWEKRADDIKEWLNKKKLTQPVLFTELGYPSVDGANVQPWIGISEKTDRKEQADCYEASYQVLTKRDWFRGFYWWHYLPNDQPMQEDLRIRSKPAEKVMSRWNKKMKKK